MLFLGLSQMSPSCLWAHLRQWQQSWSFSGETGAGALSWQGRGGTVGTPGDTQVAAGVTISLPWQSHSSHIPMGQGQGHGLGPGWDPTPMEPRPGSGSDPSPTEPCPGPDWDPAPMDPIRVQRQAGIQPQDSGKGQKLLPGRDIWLGAHSLCGPGGATERPAGSGV